MYYANTFFMPQNSPTLSFFRKNTIAQNNDLAYIKLINT